MKIFYLLFASLKTAIPLMAIYAILCAVATFIENDYGASAARALIYDTWFFNVLHAWLLVCFCGIIIKNKLFAQKKYASLLLHLSFVVIIIGAGITRFFGSEGVMHIREGQTANSFMSAENYINISIIDDEQKYEINIPTNISPATSKKLDEKVIFGDKSFQLISNRIEARDKSLGGAIAHCTIIFNGKEYAFLLVGGEGEGVDTFLDLEGIDLSINWGAREVELPFALRLDEFILERYAGSMSPSSYQSNLTLIDGDKTSNVEIYMNHTLDHNRYRFFQSSYDMDEQGTILSVNNDPGKIPTYIGYAMLFISAVWILFARNSRFRALGRFLSKQNIYGALFIALASLNYPLYAQDSNNNILENLESLKNNSKNHAKLFGELQIQDYGGRVKPLDTLASDLVHKMTKKDKFLGLENTQIILGMLIYPNEWRNIKMLKISTPKLREIIGVKSDEQYVSFQDLFLESGEYKLTNYVEEANRMKPNLRGSFEKDLLNIDERANIAYGIYTSQLLKMFPIPNNGEVWLSPIDMMAFGSDYTRGEIGSLLSDYFVAVDEGLAHNTWDSADIALEAIKSYQLEHSASEVILSDAKLKSEIFLNHANIFASLIFPYIALGLIILILVFFYIFTNKPFLLKALKVLYIFACVLMLVHLAALILRWYVAGHAPWSNAYESMLYISFSSTIAGLVFFRKSYLAIAAAIFLAGISLFVAHLGFMDPQIGNLVPVLKSYWLNIHVSVITASYGFFGLCFLLGILTLILFILRKKSLSKIDSTINSIVAINEMSMILGLMLLVVGNFLGGIWANESWGRYWGWDPKETWALISIGVYAIILHLRFICSKNLQYIFSSASVVGFFSVLMTYFGVNYYLSGLHSYAAGDPLPIPTFLYVLVAFVLALIIFAFFKRNMESVKI